METSARTRPLALPAGIALITSLALLLAAALLATPAAATPDAQNARTIEYLLEYVRDSDVTFVRNFSKHSPAEAADHIEQKYRHFRDRIRTPEDFIDLCASKSLMTGRPYTVIDAQGRKIPTRDWLLDALQAWRNAPARKPND